MEIVVQVRSVYGNDLVYPQSPIAHLFALLIGAKTFNAKRLRLIKELGYEIKVDNGDVLPFAV